MTKLGRWSASATAFSLVFVATSVLHAEPSLSAGRVVSGARAAADPNAQSAAQAIALRSLFRFPAFLSLGNPNGGGSKLSAESRGVGPTSDCGTRCLDHHVGVSQGRNATAAILTGVAAAGIGVALVIVLTRPSRAEKSDFVPVLKLRLSGQRAGASATWRF